MWRAAARVNRERRYTGSCGDENGRYEYLEVEKGGRDSGVGVRTYSDCRIEHRSCPCAAFGACAADHFRAAELEFTRLSALVCHTGAVEHLVERELFDELSGSIWGCLVVFREVLAKTFIMQYLWPNHVSKNWFKFPVEKHIREDRARRQARRIASRSL